MSIQFDAESGIFHLQTVSCSYALQKLPSGHLAHLYWGAPVRNPQAHLLVLQNDRAFSPDTDPKLRGFSLDTVPNEFPAYGNSDFRSPAIEVQRADGSTVSDFRYQAHRIFEGKDALDGLPATYVEAAGEATTLEIDLADEVTGLEVTLTYCAFEKYGALTRSVRLSNEGSEALRIGRLYSATVDFPNSDFEFLQLSGAWARERDLHRVPIRPGSQAIESRRGASGHEHNPFFALLSPGTDESHGEVYAFNLVHSGSFKGEVEVAQYSTARAQIGINPFDFSWLLEPGETFQSPEAVMVYAANGLGEMSRTFHKLYRERLCRGVWRDKERPVLVNSWEGSYFDITEENIESLAVTASEVGIELLVMDDGWFGVRDNDTTSLGDWFVHRTKFPRGLAPLAQRINDLGLQFGLWFEPEMISPNSELYREHPDWCLHVPDRHRTQARNQLILDLSRDEVCDYLIEVIGEVLSTVSIGYVKWDMNRNMTEIGSATRGADRQRETAHRYMLGLYRVLETITSRFPNVLFESCSGGGGRFDPGILFYMPQTWTSDNTDAISRLNIQYGTSLVYPASSLGAHVSASPNHQVNRHTSLQTRGLVAMSGTFGYELDLTLFTDEEKALVRNQVETFKSIRPLVFKGLFYRLLSPFEGNETAWMFVSEDRREAAVFFIRTLAQPNAPFPRLRLAGLDGGRDYQVEELVGPGKSAPLTLGGDVLMNAGFRPPNLHGDFAACLWRLRVSE